MPTIELNVDNQQISLVQADNNEEAFRRSFESSLANEPIINLQSPIPIKQQHQLQAHQFSFNKK
jgi:hypothetical protein